MNQILELIIWVAVALAIAITSRAYVIEPHKVSGHSMVPNFQDGDFLMTNIITLRLSDPQRGEVVILYNPRNHNQQFIKRIIGLPNEKVALQNGEVFVNNKKLNEPYLPNGLKTPGGAYLTDGDEVSIPSEQYFVMGDNRPGSSDSREWGPVKRELLIGQAWLRLWPLYKMQVIGVGTELIHDK